MKIALSKDPFSRDLSFRMIAMKKKQFWYPLANIKNRTMIHRNHNSQMGKSF
jgi:hypothetical protein